MMSPKNIRRLLLLLATLLASFGFTGSALAWSGCGVTYAVQRGDTLSSIASKCGISVAALRQANPSLGYWLYAGQTLVMPGHAAGAPLWNPAARAAPHAAGTYVVQWGDTLRKIADRMNISLNDLIAANPRIWNPNWIFAGQVINLPAPAQYYVVQPGDTLRNIAARFGTGVASLLALNPQIWNPDLIYTGQAIRLW